MVGQTLSVLLYKLRQTSRLHENFETCEGNILARCELYTQYLSYCVAKGIATVHASSFGKIIRSVFRNIRARRIGNRGNSKYHYSGIKARKEKSPQHHDSEKNVVLQPSPATYAPLNNISDN